MITPLESIPPLASDYKDRSTGLKTFGILVIILGAFCSLSIPLTLFGGMMAAKQQASEFDVALIIPALVLFAVMAGALIWLGIGSIKARRWARTLLLCLGWLGLFIGAYALVMLVPTLRTLDASFRYQGQAISPTAVLFAKIATVTITLVMYVVIPGALVLFYGSRNVRLTCEHRDPVIRWTDRCPIPVLIVCILQAIGLIYVLPVGRFTAVFPVAGYMITGMFARLMWTAFGLLSLYCAWGFYHLKLRAWGVYFVLILAVSTSAIIGFLRVDPQEFYRHYGLSPKQLEQVATSPLLQAQHLPWVMGGGLALTAGYLLYLRRYFVTSEKSSRLA